MFFFCCCCCFYIDILLNPCPVETGYTLPLKQCRSRSVGFCHSEEANFCHSEEVNWSVSALFAIQYVNLYEQSGSSNLIGWKFEKRCGILIYSAWQELIPKAIHAVRHGLLVWAHKCTGQEKGNLAKAQTSLCIHAIWSQPFLSINISQIQIRG